MLVKLDVDFKTAPYGLQFLLEVSLMQGLVKMVKGLFSTTQSLAEEYYGTFRTVTPKCIPSCTQSFCKVGYWIVSSMIQIMASLHHWISSATTRLCQMCKVLIEIDWGLLLDEMQLIDMLRRLMLLLLLMMMVNLSWKWQREWWWRRWRWLCGCWSWWYDVGWQRRQRWWWWWWW